MPYRVIVDREIYKIEVLVVKQDSDEELVGDAGRYTECLQKAASKIVPLLEHAFCRPIPIKLVDRIPTTV